MQHYEPGQGSWKEHETGLKQAGHNFWKTDIAQGHNINQLKSNGSKMQTSQIQLKAFNLQAKWHIWRQHDGSKALSKDQGVFPQMLEWSSHLSAYEITQPIKTNHTFHGHCTCPLLWPTLWSVLLSESEQIYLLPITVSLTEFLRDTMRHQWDIKSLNFIRS